MAKNNRDKWAFYKLPNRNPLSAADVAYWKGALPKILKIGQEFEFNLPEKANGSCKGDSNTCPCVNLKPENDCWKQCINKDGCSAMERNPGTCENVTATCDYEDCATCEHFSTKCTGLLCPNFVSSCYVCSDFSVDCANCKYHYDPNKSPDAIREHLTRQLKPNNTYGQVSQTGVHSIVTDGSLLGKKGAEVVTVGRRVDYWEFFKMAKNIIDLANEKGAYLNERCSTHMHVLASYYGKVLPGADQERMGIPTRVSEMERAMPEVVLANLHQLVRRYQNAMTWMMMGLNEQHRMTRWEKFRVSILSVSAVMNHMRRVQKEVADHAGGNKYGWINYNHIEFDRAGDISRFHVEFRAADGLMSPSAVAALGCMYYALIIKAVEVSRYGVLEIGDQAWLEQAHEVKNALLNNMKSYQDGDRFSDTRDLHRYYGILIEESLDLVHQLKPILIKIGPAYEVLEKLAERPCALRRVEGETWEDIEKDLSVIINEEGKFEIVLTEVMTLNHVSDCKDMKEWIVEVGNILRTDPELKIDEDDAEVEDRIAQFIDRNREDGRLVWSTRIGAPILV
jgi:hypothetical protein